MTYRMPVLPIRSLPARRVGTYSSSPDGDVSKEILYRRPSSVAVPETGMVRMTRNGRMPSGEVCLVRIPYTVIAGVYERTTSGIAHALPFSAGGNNCWSR